MTSQFRSVVAALKTIPNTAIIKTSWLSVQKDWPLPAIIVDPEYGVFGTITEDGVLSEVASTMSYVVCVKSDDLNPDNSIEQAENLFWLAMNAIAKAYPNKYLRIELSQYDFMPFGKNNICFGYGFKLTLSDGD